ncbi:MAG: DUF3604 domain-containing protein [Myxococcales bacterium]|nr:DUF3604 domain-containing protein [Myxococcales bacterium]
MGNRIAGLIIAGLLLGLLACDRAETRDDSSPLAASTTRSIPERVLSISDEIVEVRPQPNSHRNAYFGDLHVHTTYSFDAFSFGTTATPRDAYRYAKGETIQHPAGFDLKLREPLDFYAVTDHALFLGLAAAAADTSTEFSKLDVAESLHDLNAQDNKGVLSLLTRLATFQTFIPKVLGGLLDGSIDPEMTTQITKSAWSDIIDAAELFNEPGRFTTFVAYEYTSSTDDRGNLHRNVIFQDSDRLPAVPFSRFHSQNPEGLWDWMDGLREQGIESLAIPHNSNGSNGQMFKFVDWAGDPLDDDYAEQRLRNEPLVEITQIKGTSETHPSLSDTDEWANFEIMPYRVATTLPSEPAGSYVRDALRRGLSLEERRVVNPYKFGVIGSSDTHTGAISDDESNFSSKLGLLDSTPELRGSAPLPAWQSFVLGFAQSDLVAEIEGEDYIFAPTPTFGASGLAGVWAEENTRDAIYRGFRRKEVFATSGPRIRIRFFAGFDLDEALLADPDAISQAYRRGVSMGSDLAASGDRAPRLFAWALRDPLSAPLQRLQIVKGWATEEQTFERVYDIACSDGATPDPEDHRCPDNGARVDPSDCSYPKHISNAQLMALWRDPHFDPDQHAFYYARVLENPTCRWSTWDAIRKGVPPRPDLAATIQERAWSSPIWYVPGTDAVALR